ncbi:MAG: pyridoxal kinase, partial [Burkholderiaceae bacterium]
MTVVPTILSISSQVVYGHVGNAAIVPALQALGCEVLAMPTVLLAHHPGHRPPKGRGTPAEELAALLDGLEQVGALAGASAMLSGYLGRADNAVVAADAITRLRQQRAGALYLCDPVIGDDGRVYVGEGVEDAIRTRLLPLADVLTPNHFELERLSGQRVTTLAQAVAAAHVLLRLGPRTVVVTSLQHEQQPADRVATLAVTAQAGWLVS